MNAVARSLIAAAVAALALVSAALLDAPVDHWAASHQVAAWVTAAKLCSLYLSWPWLMIAAAVTLLLAWRLHRREWMRVLCAMMIAASVAGLSADFLRSVIGRTRPYAQVTQGFYGPRHGSEWLIGKHAYNSFPSGHATTIVAFVVPLLVWRRSLGALLLPAVGAVAVARVYVGAHHLSDIVAGAILGSVVALLVWRRVNARSPQPVPA